MDSFWTKLKKPIMVLAPMADVTDVAFRRIIAKYGKPDVLWTEFVSADGLALAPKEAKKKLLKDLEYSEAERPIVAQFFTSSPENMKKAAELAYKLGFDGIDINMGCPDKTVEKQGAGALLLKDVEKAKTLVRAAKSGSNGLPVSIKIRIGYNKPNLDVWLPEILKESLAVITVHARTRKEMSKAPADWSMIKRAVEIRDASGQETLILGNGDVRDLKEAMARVSETGCDGVMLGRAIFGNPFLFSKKKCPEGTEGLRLKLKILVEHTKLFEELLMYPAKAGGSANPNGGKSFSVMKKHFKSYVSGFDGAVELRTKLMEASNANEVEAIIKTSYTLGDEKV